MARKMNNEFSQKEMVKRALEKSPDLTGQALADQVKADFGVEISKQAASVYRSKLNAEKGSSKPKKKAASVASQVTDGHVEGNGVVAKKESLGDTRGNGFASAIDLAKKLGGVAETTAVLDSIIAAGGAEKVKADLDSLSALFAK